MTAGKRSEKQLQGVETMSGHSKWSTIKRKKGAADAKRGALFTKLAREIQIAAREGADPEYNFKLRLAVDKAKANSMPKENIDRAIRRGSGLESGEELLETAFEGYGPGGVALYIEVLTDNRNRAVAEIRHTLSRGNGAMGESGSVAWQFEPRGAITVTWARTARTISSRLLWMPAPRMWSSAMAWPRSSPIPATSRRSRMPFACGACQWKALN
jgi:YebC/PmpR family DNA-binding regulatory protein